MRPPITSDQRKQVESGIREKYARVAAGPGGQFAYPTGRPGLEQLNYNHALIATLPDEAASFYCGVGNPFSLGNIQPGERVLDVGCGAGVDTLLAGLITGPQGTAVGIDVVPEMVDRAAKSLASMALGNITFCNASGELLPFANRSFEVVISNGAINLIPDKAAALSEIERVLKPGGRLMLADQIAVGNVAKDLQARLASWFQ